MRITIDIDRAGATFDAPAAPTAGPGTEAAGTGTGAFDDASVADLERRTGATSAGPAPAGPDAPSGGPGSSGAGSTTPQWAGDAESAGAAPESPG